MMQVGVWSIGYVITKDLSVKVSDRNHPRNVNKCTLRKPTAEKCATRYAPAGHPDRAAIRGETSSEAIRSDLIFSPMPSQALSLTFCSDMF